jgi:RsiW-degrading membrane proteinase PrsW (M82 family)
MLYTALAACALVTAQVIRRYDLHAREPIWALAVALVLGAIGMELAGLAQTSLISRDARPQALNYNQLAIRAGVTEELAKFAAAGLMVVLARRHLDEGVDGIIYGAFAGLGAALAESAHILSHAGAAPAPRFPPEEIVRLAGHLVMGGIGSVGWGAVGARWQRPLPWLVIPLLGAILLHVLWDIVAFDAMVRVNRQLPGLWINATLSILLMLSGLIAFRLLVRHAASHPPRGNPKPSNPSVAP